MYYNKVIIKVSHVFIIVCDRTLSPYRSLEHRFSSKAFSNVNLLSREQVKGYNLVCVSILILKKHSFFSDADSHCFIAVLFFFVLLVVVFVIILHTQNKDTSK